MNEFIGRQIDFAIANEAVRGTAESVADRTLRKVTCNLTPQAETVVDDTTFGRLEDAERVRTVRKWSEGDVTGIVHADVLGYYLTSLYGTPISAPVSNGVHTHNFELEQSITHPTLTFFVKDGEVRQEKIAGGVVSSLDLNVTTDDYVRFTANFLGKQGVADNSVLPALATEYDFVSRDATVEISNTSNFGTSETLKLKTLDLTFDSNAEADWVFGDYSPENIYNKQFSIEGTFTRNFTDTTFKDFYEGAEERFMKITIEGEADIGGGNRPKLVIDLAKVQVLDWERSSEGDDLSTETVNFKAFYNAIEGYQSKVTLQNLTEDYGSLSS